MPLSQAKSTGQLSIITAFLNFGGSVARIFTSLQEQVGSAMVQGYVIGMCFIECVCVPFVGRVP